MTSQTCHNCNSSYKIGDLKDYKCKKCGLTIGRDIIDVFLGIYLNES